MTVAASTSRLFERPLALPRAIDVTPSRAAVTLIAVRWGAWLIAAVYVLWGPSLPVYTDREPELLILAFVQTLVLTAYPLALRPLLARRLKLRQADESTDLLALGLLDVVLAMGLLHLSGGWASPFYHVATTSLVVPAFLVRPHQAALLLVAFELAYVGVLATAGPGTDGNWTGAGRPNLFGHLMTAVMVIGAVQFLAHLTRQLEKERDEKQALAAQEERARIAREIHDGVAQSIYMLTFNLERAAAAADQPELRQRLQQLVLVAKESLLEVRQYIFDIRPLLQGETDLGEAIRGQTREFNTISGLPIDLEISGDPAAVPLPVAAAAYRLTQEALANAFRHSGASQLNVRLEQTGAALAISVVDNGVGFEPGGGDGHGLKNMRDRVEDMGGSLLIHSAPAAGTRVEVTLPFQHP